MILFGYVALMDFGRRGYDFSGDVIRAISRNSPARLNPAVVLFPSGELVSFGILVVVGFCYRNRSEIHKRLMRTPKTCAMRPAAAAWNRTVTLVLPLTRFEGRA